MLLFFRNHGSGAPPVVVSGPGGGPSWIPLWVYYILGR